MCESGDMSQLCFLFFTLPLLCKRFPGDLWRKPEVRHLPGESGAVDGDNLRTSVLLHLSGKVGSKWSIRRSDVSFRCWSRTLPHWHYHYRTYTVKLRHVPFIVYISHESVAVSSDRYLTYAIFCEHAWRTTISHCTFFSSRKKIYVKIIIFNWYRTIFTGQWATMDPARSVKKSSRQC